MNNTNKKLHPSESLPSYKNPPVNEVVCGLRFETSDDLKIPHMGLIWEKFRKDYPIIQHNQPIASARGEITIDTSIGSPLPRLWFINNSGDQLIQFQVDRFFFNWRRMESNYPRYDYVISKFINVYNTIEDFFKEFKLGEIIPIEYELSYINHIPNGQGWETVDDLPKIFLDFVWKKSKKRFLPNPDKVSWLAEFLLPDNKGHLIVNLKQATRTKDKATLLVLELKTRGISETRNIREWFDLSHEWIVRGFSDITTDKIQEIWERECQNN